MHLQEGQAAKLLVSCKTENKQREGAGGVGKRGEEEWDSRASSYGENKSWD